MKEFAIREDHLYRKTYLKGKKASSRTVTVYVLRDYAAEKLKKQNPQKKTLNRIGLTVTKKLGGAVTRNRTKRIIREAFRHVQSAYKLRTGFLVVIVAHSACVGASSREVEADLTRIFGKLGFFLA